MKKMFGVCVAMTTSFDKNGNVDFEEMNRHAEMLIRNGVHGLYPNGTTGECMHLTIAERKRLAEEMVKTAAGRVVVFSQVGAPTLEETIELAKHAEACGCDGIGVVTPFYHGVTDREMEEFYVDVASAVSENFPVYIYNIPACSGNDIKPEVAKRVMERCKNVIGIKYSSPDVRRTMDYLKIGDVSFMHGVDRLGTTWYAMGCDGVISGGADAFPEPYVACYEEWKKGNTEESLRMMDACYELNVLMNGFRGIKQAITYRGLKGGAHRKPILDLPEAEVAAINKKLDAYVAKWGFSKTYN